MINFFCKYYTKTSEVINNTIFLENIHYINSVMLPLHSYCTWSGVTVVAEVS